MKKLSFLSLLVLAAGGTAFGEDVTFNPSSQTVVYGQTFTVAVDITFPDLYDYQFSMNFNPQVLQVDGLSEGSLFSTNPAGGNFGYIGYDNTAGTITDVYDSLTGNVPGVAGPGDIAVIQFTAIGDGTSDLSVDSSNAQDFIFQTAAQAGGNSQLSLTSQDGSVLVVSPEPATVTLFASGLGLVLVGLIRRKSSLNR